MPLLDDVKTAAESSDTYIAPLLLRSCAEGKGTSTSLINCTVFTLNNTHFCTELHHVTSYKCVIQNTAAT